MTTHRCEKHGVFSGNVGCPWCKAEAEAQAKPSAGVQVESRSSERKKGVKIMSKGGVPEPEKRVKVESKSEGGSAETSIEVGVPGATPRTRIEDTRHD